MPYNETQLTKLIEDVEKEFTAHLAKAEEDSKSISVEPEGSETSLSKAEEGDKKPEKKPEEKEAPKPEAEAKPEAKPEAEAKPAEAEAKPEESHADHDYDAEDMEHLHKMYMSMSKGELKVHHDAAKAALDKCGEIEASAPHGAEGKEAPASHSHPAVQKAEHSDGLIKPSAPKGSPGAQSPASKDQKNLSNLEKGEPSRESGGKYGPSGEPKGSPGAKSPASKAQGNLSDMEKSENVETELLKAELAAEKGKFEELKKNFDAVAAFLTKLVEKKAAPAAKAITSLDAIAKSEGAGDEQPLTKSEIDSKLLQKSQDPNLKKSDRDAINAFYLDGAGVQSISHLLK